MGNLGFPDAGCEAEGVVGGAGERPELGNPQLDKDLEVGVVMLPRLSDIVAALGDDLALTGDAARKRNVQGHRQRQKKR